MKDHLRLASLDLGTNSTRLLVAECDGVRTETVDRRMVITRLGEGVDGSRYLLPAAVERTIAAISGFVDVMRPLEPVGVVAAATSVLRDSRNGQQFIDRVEKMLGARTRILAGDEEARLSFLGAVSDLEAAVRVGEGGAALVFDIGGGSTEFVVGEYPMTKKDLTVKSVDVGCVRMTERFLTKSDPPSPLAVGRMEAFLVASLKPVTETLRALKPTLVVGLAGTVTTLSGIKQNLEEYDTERIHHSRLTRQDVEEMFMRLVTATVARRRDIMGLEPGRADIIVGGIAVLRAIMDLTGLDEILVSEKDILDGLVIDLYNNKRECRNW
ncbi:MAG: exopolyphosphatase [Candidatus Anoxymicrobium japonicum]|uniref:Exopolyphosphatase n=1 Tax=Candidatus Anoxymicrobium japonicum TaxID=2013648 RepID=A0A2N3G4U4_9ACTN|nr:MAG: exopolyphosphatase [Candidatus Anoxymicrobium japonicum]